MAYLSATDLEAIGFKELGANVKISEKASIYDADLMRIGDNCRVDDFCVLSGKVELGDFIHITPMCIIAGGEPGILVGDFTTLAYGTKVFAQSDDYSGETMCNSLVPRRFKSELFRRTDIGRQVIVGAGSVIMPGANVAEGCAIGAMSLIHMPTEPWGVYAGVPARRIKNRSRKLLRLEAEFKDSIRNDRNTF